MIASQLSFCGRLGDRGISIRAFNAVEPILSLPQDDKTRLAISMR
jgi:hypothetical protein